MCRCAAKLVGFLAREAYLMVRANYATLMSSVGRLCTEMSRGHFSETTCYRRRVERWGSLRMP